MCESLNVSGGSVSGVAAGGVEGVSSKLFFLRPDQLRKVSDLVDAFVEGVDHWSDEVSDFADENWVSLFGDLNG